MNKFVLFSSVIFILVTFSRTVIAIEKREPCAIPLSILTVHFNAKTGNLDEVFISYGSKEEGWAIAPVNDRYIKFTIKKQVDHIYRENPAIAYQLTEFEAKHLNKICNTFIRTLTIFERNLQKRSWGKLLYMDSYFPNFFKGFYYLMKASRCYKDPLPRYANIPDSLYDNSFNSIKTDRRIQTWRSKPDRIIKLRIITKEVIHQMKEWQKMELANPNRDPRDNYAQEFYQAYGLFIRLYFNMMNL